MKFTLQIDPTRTLAQLLAESGCALDLRCNGNGTCGRCRVKLLSGLCSIDGRELAAPCELLACRARILSETADVEVPDAARRSGGGNILAEWTGTKLPSIDEPVIAIDIGTTTIAAVKVQRGEVVAMTSAYNPQNSLGDNVITRIHLASQGQLNTLSDLVINGIQQLLDQMGIQDVKRIAVAGNTVMSCLFHRINPSSIGVLPFTPPLRAFPERHDLFGGIPVLTVPAISGYVGGDLTAGMAIANLKPGQMLIDIGTNCEIIFVTAEDIVCTAAAAGPAFEGAGLQHGCRAVDGAIDHCFADGTFSTINNAPPVGICGSGYVDFLAVQHAAGHINYVGRYEPKATDFHLTTDIFITESDIEQLLKAKAAIWAGIETLEAYCGTRAETIMLAGGFARHLNLRNAHAINMLPPRTYEILGNASLAGAALLACNPEFINTLIQLIDQPREISLNTISSFEDHFIDGLLLP